MIIDSNQPNPVVAAGRNWNGGTTGTKVPGANRAD